MHNWCCQSPAVCWMAEEGDSSQKNHSRCIGWRQVHSIEGCALLIFNFRFLQPLFRSFQCWLSIILDAMVNINNFQQASKRVCWTYHIHVSMTEHKRCLESSDTKPPCELALSFHSCLSIDSCECSRIGWAGAGSSRSVYFLIWNLALFAPLHPQKVAAPT